MTVRIVVEGPPKGVDYALQKGSGTNDERLAHSMLLFRSVILERIRLGLGFGLRQGRPGC